MRFARRRPPGCSPSNRDPLDLIERDPVAGAVVKLGGLWAFVSRDLLGLLQSTDTLHPK